MIYDSSIEGRSGESVGGREVVRWLRQSHLVLVSCLVVATCHVANEAKTVNDKTVERLSREQRKLNIRCSLHLITKR